MRNLLKLAMRDRWTASLAAFLLSALSLAPLLQFPFMVLALSLVALTCFSRGLNEGLLISLWAMLPIGAAAFSGLMGDGGIEQWRLLNLIPFPWALACALLLRYSGSWPWALAANTLCALLCALLLQWLAGDFLSALVEGSRAMLEQMMQENEEALARLQQTLTAGNYAVMYSNGIALLAVVCLILGRYWQAMLYKPGGLRSELHQLRLPLPLALVLAALWLGALWLMRYSEPGYAWRGYASILSLPLLVAGLALAHALAARRNAAFTLTLLYAALLLFPPLRALLTLVAAADSQWDFRARIGGPSPPPDRTDDSADQLSGPRTKED